MKRMRYIFSTAVLTAACLLLAPYAAADQVINDDVIVTFSLCVGNDCINGESFGFDTIRLKENNLRIDFEDTSNTASFPTNDWGIVINDSSNGGASYFAVEDRDFARQVFRVDAGAPANSLRVDSGGDVGIGASNPVVELHVKDGDSPTLRLEQDGSSGFTPQIWDVAGNEANFFVRDVSSGSTLPFKIKPGGAPSNSLVIAGSGDVGFGTQTPSSPIHALTNTSGEVQMLDLENSNASGESSFRLSTGQGDWKINTTSGATVLQFSKVGTGVGEMRLSDGGFLEITGGLVSTQGGGACTAADPCDAVFSPKFYVESIEEHAEFMWENSHLKGVGPTNENGPINITEKTGGLINELEKAHIYIERLNEQLKTKAAKVHELEQRLARLEEALLAK